MNWRDVGCAGVLREVDGKTVAAAAAVRNSRRSTATSPKIVTGCLLDQKAVLRWLKEVGTASPDAQMEVVMYGKGFELAMPDRSPYIEDVKGAMKIPT